MNKLSPAGQSSKDNHHDLALSDRESFWMKNQDLGRVCKKSLISITLTY